MAGKAIVDLDQLSFLLDLPPEVRLVTIEPTKDDRRFTFVLEGTDPETGSALDGDYDIVYRPTDGTTIEFAYFDKK